MRVSPSTIWVSFLKALRRSSRVRSIHPLLDHATPAGRNFLREQVKTVPRSRPTNTTRRDSSWPRSVASRSGSASPLRAGDDPPLFLRVTVRPSRDFELGEAFDVPLQGPARFVKSLMSNTRRRSGDASTCRSCSGARRRTPARRYRCAALRQGPAPSRARPAAVKGERAQHSCGRGESERVRGRVSDRLPFQQRKRITAEVGNHVVRRSGRTDSADSGRIRRVRPRRGFHSSSLHPLGRRGRGLLRRRARPGAGRGLVTSAARKILTTYYRTDSVGRPCYKHLRNSAFNREGWRYETSCNLCVIAVRRNSLLGPGQTRLVGEQAKSCLEDPRSS